MALEQSDLTDDVGSKHVRRAWPRAAETETKGTHLIATRDICFSCGSRRVDTFI